MALSQAGVAIHKSTAATMLQTITHAEAGVPRSSCCGGNTRHHPIVTVRCSALSSRIQLRDELLVAG
jgi:hypothetical protein